MFVYHKHQNANAAKHLETKLEALMEKVNALPIRGLYKLQIYERYITACLRFDLSVHDVSTSRLEELDRIVRKLSRKWCAMPPSAHVSMIFHSAGLDITEPSHIYRQGHASLLLSANADDVYLQEAMSSATQLQETQSAQQDIITDIAAMSKDSKHLKNINTAVRDSLLESHASHLSKQGGWVDVLASCDESVDWKACISGLSEPTFAFAVKALSDSLPSNSNLKLWNKIVSSQCNACGNQNQTIHHILNNCQSHLNLYSWRHDNVLHVLHSFLVDHIKHCDVNVDLVTADNRLILESHRDTIPCDIFPTVLRPDIVLINKQDKHIVIIELTIPFERNFEAAQQRKSAKYASLIAGIEEVGYKCSFFSLEVGSRGVISNGAFSFLKKLSGASRQEVRQLLLNVSQVAIKCSYIIFKERDNARANYSNII